MPLSNHEKLIFFGKLAPLNLDQLGEHVAGVVLESEWHDLDRAGELSEVVAKELERRLASASDEDLAWIAERTEVRAQELDQNFYDAMNAVEYEQLRDYPDQPFYVIRDANRYSDIVWKACKSQDDLLARLSIECRWKNVVPVITPPASFVSAGELPF